MKWLEINTAPKNKTILAWAKEWIHPKIIFWEDNEWREAKSNQTVKNNPTYWTNVVI